MKKKFIIGITGASGSVYAVRLLEELSDQCEITLVVSDTAKRVIADETEVEYEDVMGLANEIVDNRDLASTICSGSRKYDAMVIVPCSMTTLAKLACGISDNAITRAASVALKERRKLIIVPRETPMSTIQLENMLKLSRDGAIMLPAMPGFYGRPETAMELVDFIVGRILDLLDVENSLCPRWAQEEE